VLVVTGSSARMTARTKDAPVDAAIVGIVDTVALDPALSIREGARGKP
jgi:microcompartment protein CcmK/EutM